jgi:ferrous iron transport protein A
VKLSQVKVGSKVKINDFGTDCELALILLGMGLLPGDVVEVVQRAPFGSPLAIKKSTGHFFALRGSQAHCISVSEE